MDVGKTLLRALAGLAATAAAGLCVAQGTTYSTIERGRYLAAAGDCLACHTAPGGKPYAGGLPIATPFGTIYSTNITPDAQTGIGRWSEDDFYRAMHDGIRRDGQHLYPAFPYPWFTRITRDDVRALKAYLDTVAPVRQQDKPTELPWPLDERAVVGGWNTLYFHAGAFTPDTHKSPQWNRGAYLVEGLGHCGACHTAKNLAGGTERDEKLQGGRFGEHWYAPSLADAIGEGLGDWSVPEIVQYLQTGSNVHSAAGGPMADVIRNSTQYLTDDDLQAIATYLKDLPPAKDTSTAAAGGEGQGSDAVDPDVMARGKALYFDNCIGCHMENGRGLEGVFPALAGSSAVLSEAPGTLIHALMEGLRKPATRDKPVRFAMPAFGWKLDDRQIADVLTYIRNAWGNHAPATDADAVAQVRDDVAHNRGE